MWRDPSPILVGNPHFSLFTSSISTNTHGCINEVEEDMLKIAEDEVVYKLGPEVEVAIIGTEDSNDTAVPEPPPSSPTPRIRNPASPP